MESVLETSSEMSLIDNMGVELRNRLSRHQEIGKNAAEAILEALENIVRVGWLLADVRYELKGCEEAFETWVDCNLPIGVSQALNYVRVCKHFERDQENIAWREKCGLDPMLIDVIGELTVRQQILAVSANSFADLMRVAGVAKPKPALPSSDKKTERPPFFKAIKTLSAADVRLTRLNKISPFSDLSDMERSDLAHALMPFVALYNEIMDNLPK
jgi:hypothetical protein